MQRIIKFRAWQRTQKRMLHNVSTGTVRIFGDKAEGQAEARDCDFMQFTGLHDKNGKEIWEGDIFGYEEKGQHRVTKEVAWNHTLLGWEIKDGVELWGIREDAEVIGNIYENPELLKSI